LSPACSTTSQRAGIAREGVEQDVVTPLGFLALVLASWALRPASRTVAAPTSDRDAAPRFVAAAA